MRVVLCEDKQKEMEALLDLCDRYGLDRGYRLEVDCYAHVDLLLADAASRGADIMLLDIMMPQEGQDAALGVEAARHLRAEGYRGEIIFTSSSPDFYPEGFEVGAAHYLLKPLPYEAFAHAMDRAVARLRRPERMIRVPVDRIAVTIPQNRILYAEVYGHETILHTTTEPLRVLLPLKNIEKLLEGDPFLRCYRSYIVNMDYIIEMEESCFVLRSSQRIPLTVRKRSALRERYFAYRLSKAP